MRVDRHVRLLLGESGVEQFARTFLAGSHAEPVDFTSASRWFDDRIAVIVSHVDGVYG
jgi:hypothetical protein